MHSSLPYCSFSVARYIAAWVLRAFLSVCLCLSWPQAFWTKINIIYRHKFSVVSKEQVQSWILGSLHFIWQHTEQTREKTSPVRLINGSEQENKNNMCCKEFCVNTQTTSNNTHLYFNNSYWKGALSQLIFKDCLTLSQLILKIA